MSKDYKYKFKDSSNNIRYIYLPVYTDAVNVKGYGSSGYNSYNTMKQEITSSGGKYDENVSRFCSPTAYTRAISLGFPSELLYDLSTLGGDTWTYANDSNYTISFIDNSNGTSFNFTIDFKINGTSSGTISLNNAFSVEPMIELFSLVDPYKGTFYRMQSFNFIFQTMNGATTYPSNWKAFSGSASDIEKWLNFWNGIAPVDSDPYADGGGASSGGGGTGDFDDTSDIIPIPSLPSISGLNTGFFTAFVCTQSQLQSVSNYLWTNVIDDIIDTSTGLGEKVDALKKMVTSPYDAIMGCSLVPVSPPTGGSKDLKMYGVIDTGITLPYASSRWVAVDCGTLNIHEFWGSYLDYSPYTKTTSLYLPYIGVVSVDIDLIMSKALQVVYHVDILTGICIAYIVVDGSVKFQYQGHCSTTIPVTSSDYSGAIQSGLGLVGNIANVVSAGASGGLSGGLGGATLGAVSSAISQAPSVASNVMGMKPDIKSGGGVGSSGGILGVQKPFLIIERPKQSVPAFQNGFSGYPCNMTMTLKDLSGYTEVERINLTNISLTEDEKNELLEILQSGVYL